jgi:hypothetical protein
LGELGLRNSTAKIIMKHNFRAKESITDTVTLNHCGCDADFYENGFYKNESLKRFELIEGQLKCPLPNYFH